MKQNRWKNRLSLLLVALMLFTTLAPVTLAVGEPEAVTEVTAPAESDKISEKTKPSHRWKKHRSSNPMQRTRLLLSNPTK